MPSGTTGARGMSSWWYHRGPCAVHWCSICGARECFVWNPDDPDGPEVHICAAGCDGLPAAVTGVLA